MSAGICKDTRTHALSQKPKRNPLISPWACCIHVHPCHGKLYVFSGPIELALPIVLPHAILPTCIFTAQIRRKVKNSLSIKSIFKSSSK